MRILLTGSSGWLGETLAPRLEHAGHAVIGLDPLPAPTTRCVGSVTDRALVRDLIQGERIEAIIHAGALHKPQVATHAATDFVAINVQGTLNLLEEATAPGARVDRFVFTSTTSLMISAAIRAGDRSARGVDHGGDAAAVAAQHLRGHQARRRASLPHGA